MKVRAPAPSRPRPLTPNFALTPSCLPPPDARLRQLVGLLGTNSWTLIAARLGGGRNSKQCRERWHNHLDPDVKKGPWTDVSPNRPHSSNGSSL